MAFELLDGNVVYKEVKTKLPDYWENNVYKEGETTISYEPIRNTFVEPMDTEEAALLPSGVSSTDSVWLLTDTELRTYTDFETDSGLADRIYLTNPEEGRYKPQPYVVHSVAPWSVYNDMQLINDSFDYILVREGKL